MFAESSSSDHSSFTSEKNQASTPTTGVRKVKYNSESEWDFHLDVSRNAIDLSLVLPHYRARNQPLEHRMSVFVGNDSAPVKVKMCRISPASKFSLDIQAISSDVTVWLPSDFAGRIECPGRPSFSSGFLNRIAQNVRFQSQEPFGGHLEDEVNVMTSGRITFRMWDVRTGTPENTQKETLKRVFGRSQKPTGSNPIDWDFLLEE